MKCAIYCRLSREDEHVRRESESILNQKDMLTSYAAEKNWDVYAVYSDDDYSGADSGRPAFCAMLKAAEERRFDIILCKTQSRFTRDMEAVEKYIHKLLPLWGVRFVAVLDNIDTDDKSNKKARQINGLVNEWYLEDLSGNIRAVLDQKRRAGKYIASFAVYGYRKAPDDHNRLLIDPEAAETVRLIFSMYLSGLGTHKTAERLNALGILPPLAYRLTKERGGAAIQIHNGGGWSATAVSRILKNEVYLGNTVQGMTKKPSYKAKTCVRVPKSEWVRVADTHEAIIDRAAFAAANARLAVRARSDGGGEVHPLAGKLFCADCGSGFLKISHKYKGAQRSYLQCKGYAANRKQPVCAKRTVKLSELEDIVAERLGALVKQYYKPKQAKQAEPVSQAGYGEALIKKEQEAAEHRLERLATAMRSLYIDKAEGEISAALFKEMSAGILAEKAALERRILRLARVSPPKSPTPQDCGTAATPDSFLQTGRLDRLLCDLFIERIEIGAAGADARHVRIHWRV